jgi:DNA-binding MarR family transcriptional regulator
MKRLSETRGGNLRQLLVRATRVVDALIEDGLAKRGYVGVRLAHGTLLAQLDSEGNTITTVAARAEVTKQAIGLLADELEELGYLTRRIDEGDARTRILMFTERGQRLMVDLLEIVGEIEGRYIAILGEDTLNGLRTGLAAFMGINHLT